ncbi:MAG: WecB/TagA/CpsF family glycosyltransferase [Clostridia bacterium]|nr:WecB/TagA/CpsF family glycosyltransferase [Clostridia bacterium]
MEKIDVLGVKFDNVTMDEAIMEVLRLLKNNETDMVVTPNPEIVQLCYENPEVMGVMNRASLTVADGIGVIYAAKMLGTPLKGRVPGFDLASNLLRYIETGEYRLFLLGAAPGIAERAAENIKAKYPRIDICGTNDGYFSDEERIVNKINESGADICFVCLGAPKQEIFMDRHINDTCAKVMIGLGGSLDVFAGNVKRAPAWMSRMGLEWLYRLVTNPKRMRRMMKIPVFLRNVSKSKKTKS